MMERLVGNTLAHESWAEYADHSITGDNVVDAPAATEPSFESDSWWVPMKPGPEVA